METTKLELRFLDAASKKVRLSLDDPDTELSPAEIEAAMESIITDNIFASKDGDFVAAEGARVITTSINEMEF